ncbi:MAG: multicopper oxidase family protein, partial [Chloroflexota bacterium]
MAGSLSLAAGLIHLVAAPGHFNEWWGYGYFFLIAGIGQVIYGQLLFREPRRPRAFYLAGLAGTLAFIALYVVTRTAGIPPVGPAGGEREAVGALDIASELVEIALAAVLGWLATRTVASQATDGTAPASSAPVIVPPDAMPLQSAVMLRRPAVSRRTALLALGGGAGLAGVWALAGLRLHVGGPPLAAAEGSPPGSPIPTAPAAGGQMREYQITAAVNKWQLSGQQTVEAWTYNGQLPGPEIRSKVGDLVKVRITNNLPEETTVHWHGVDVPNAMDGVPDVTQKPIPRGGTFTYQFVVSTPGTYWYHSHVNEMTQVRSGLYGPFIVEPREADTRFDREQTLILADFGTVSGAAPDTATSSTPSRAGGMSGMAGMMGRGTGGMMGRGTGGMMGGTGGMGAPQQPSEFASAFIINGKTAGAIPELIVRQGERLRLRFINASASADYYMRLDGHQLQAVATDGHDLPRIPDATDLIRLSQAERVDALLVADHPGVWALHPTDPTQIQKGMQMTVRYEGQQGSSTVDQTDPRALKLWSVDQPGQQQAPATDRTVPFRLSGNMMGTSSWTINGRTYPNVNPTQASMGERMLFRVTNM